MKKNITFIFVFFLTICTYAQIIVEDSTFVSGTWTKGESPYFINGAAIVPEGDSLIIEPGTVLEFKTGTDITHSGDDSVDVGYLNIKGKLIAKGTPSQKIMFTRQGDEGYWGCISIVSTDNSILEYCTVQYASKLDNYSGAVNIYSPNTKLLNTSIVNNRNTGISTERVWNDPTTQTGSTPDIQNCIIANNKGNGLYLGYEYKSRDTIRIINNTITWNGSVGLATWGARCKVINCIFWGNSKSFSIANDRIIVSYSLIQEDILFEPPDWVTIGEGVISNFNPQLSGDFLIAFNSPCINAGKPNETGLNLPAYDIVGNARVILGCVDIGAVESTAGKFICITKPNGYEGFQAGMDVDICWKGNVSDVRLDYTVDGGVNWENIVSGTPNDSLYSWVVPAVESDRFNIRISDIADAAIFDVCDDNFKVFTSTIPDSTILSGRLTLEHSPYFINGTITVPLGDSLIIDPGVVLKFKANTGTVNVKGKLIAKGIHGQPVTFTLQGVEGFWGNIILANPKINSEMEYCIIRYASGSALGGALSIYNPRLKLLNSRIVNNSGNGIYSEDVSPEIRNCIVALNKGYGLYLRGYTVEPAKLINNSIIGNKKEGLFIYQSKSRIVNSVFWENAKSILVSGNTELSYSLVQEEILSNNSYLKIGSGMIYNLNPQFTDSANLDFHLKKTSPGIDQGDPLSDFDNEPVENGNRVNLGAYGNTAEATQTEYRPRITGLSVHAGYMFGKDTLKINGANFLASQGDGNILFENTAAGEYLFWSDDSLVCTTPPHLPDKVNINIINDNLKSGYGFECFLYTPPVVEQVDPFYLSCTGEEQVTLTGTNFGLKQNDVRILFNAVEAPSYSLWGDSVIILKSPPNPEGLADLTFRVNDSVFYTIKVWIYYSGKELMDICDYVPDTLKQGKNYLITCPLTIPEDSTLVIDPGVVVLVANNETNPVSVTINGQIIVDGTKNDTVRIISVPDKKNLWKGITLNGEGNFNYCVIKNAEYGIFQNKGTSIIENSRFANNKIGMYYYGYDAQVTSQVRNCIISDNTTGLRAEASGNHSYGKADVKLADSEFSNNEGNGIELSGHGHTSSGLIPIGQSSNVYLTLTNSIVACNGGFAIFLYSNGFTFAGIPVNGVRRAYTGLKTYNTLIFNNYKGIFSQRVNQGLNNRINAEFYNSDFRNNNTVFDIDANEVFFYNTNLWDNNISGMPAGICDSLVFESSNVNDLDSVKNGRNNISENPLYISPENGDFRLQTGSPCIDSGSDDSVDFGTDYAGNYRIWDGNGNGEARVDMGAFEFGSIPEMAPEIVSHPQGGNYCPGSQVELSVGAAVPSQMVYQWYLNGEKLVGEVNPLYLIQNLDESNAGDYTCEVSNELGNVVSNKAVVGLLPVFNMTVYEAICEGDTFLLEGIKYTQPGDIVQNLITVDGCDSIVITNLEVYPSFQPTFSVKADTLCSDEVYSYCQWYDQSGVIEGAINPELIITKSGDYILEATNENGCTYSSDPIYVQHTLSQDIDKCAFSYSLMPNPSDGLFTFSIDSNPPEKFNIKLINDLGQVIEIREIENPVINQIELFNGSHLSKGIYHFVIIADNFIESNKIVIQ